MHRLIARLAKGAALAALGLFLLGLGSLGALLIAYSAPNNEVIRVALILGFCLPFAGAGIALFMRRWRWRGLLGLAALCAGLIVLWTGIQPTNDRDWRPEVAVLPYATFSG